MHAYASSVVRVTLTTSPASSSLGPVEAHVPASRGLAARLWTLTEVRGAALASVTFAAGSVMQVTGTPAPVWWALYLVCYAAGGWAPALTGIRALRGHTLDVDLLMIVAACGAASIGQVFDGALLIVIFATSGALEAVATARTADSVRALLDLAPERANRIRPDETEETVSTLDLQVGDVIRIRPGERIGADAIVVGGASEADQATITGEPLPVTKTTGDEVFAGTLNGTGTLTVQVHRPTGQSVIARIVALVEEASATKARTQLFIEKVEQRYSIGVVVATVALFAIPLLSGAALRPTLLRAMTFMIVASPCAVVLATMPPLLSAIALAGRHGVLVKSAVVMERLADTTLVAFDKTGTLTEGTPRLVGIHVAFDGSSDGQSTAPAIDADRLLQLAAGAEHPSEHPVAAAVLAAARDRNLAIPTAHDFTSTPGRGVSATVDGHHVQVGSPSLLDGPRAGPTASPLIAQTRGAADAAQASGHTAVIVTIDHHPTGVLTLTDRTRPHAAATVAALTRLTGTPPVLLTGDNPGAAARLATELGIHEAHGKLLPSDKVTRIHALQNRRQRVLLVGDGVNDAPALAVADLGVAMGRHSSDLALQTADAVLVRDDLTTLPTVIALSRHARRIVTANLAIAATFITALVAWDLFGHLPLPLGVAGHEGSTLIVALNGLRLLHPRAWRTPQTHPVSGSSGRM
ncbi:heavy metal translocating P-type ATPase [Protofrankia symbiont of Coriaria ruscifolia]